MSLQLPFGGRQVLDDALETWGEEEQVGMAYEEMGELITALHQYKRGRVLVEKVRGEVADVFIMVSQLAIMLGENLVQEIVDAKVDRLEKRIESHRVSYEVKAQGELPV